MLKKVISIMLALCIGLSMSIIAVNAVNETVSEVPQGTGKIPGGGWGGMPPMGEMPPEDFTPPQGNFTPPQNSDLNNNAEATPQTDGNTSTENPQMPSGNPQFGGQMPGGMGGFPGNMQNFNQDTQAEQETGFLGFVKTNSTPITAVILLALAFIFVIFYRRKNY